MLEIETVICYFVSPICIGGLFVEDSNARMLIRATR